MSTNQTIAGWAGYHYLVSRHSFGPLAGEIIWTAHRRIDCDKAETMSGTAMDLNDGVAQAKAWLGPDASRAQ